MEKRLYRNQHSKFIAGVASGLADYMDVDVVMVRLLFVLSTVFIPGTGILVYIVLWIVAPPNHDPAAKFRAFNDFYQKNDPMYGSPNAFSNPSNSGEQTKWNTPNFDEGFKPQPDPHHFEPSKQSNDTSRTIGGLVLLLLGVFLLLKYTFDVIPAWFSIWKLYKLWPIAIIAVGISLIFRNQRKTEWEKFKKTTEEEMRSKPEQPVEDATIIKENDQPTPNV